MPTVGDGADGFTGFVLKRFGLLKDVELSGTVGHHGRLLDGAGHVAIVVLDVADEKRTAGRPVKLHVPNFVDGVKGMANMADPTDAHAHRHRNKRIDRSKTAVNDGDVHVL